MDRIRSWALRLIIGLNIIALVVSFGESFAGLYEWAQHHSVTGLGAAVWPLMIDVIILIGEAGLFVAHKDAWRVRDKIWMWFVVLTALGVSAAGNVGHIISTDWLSHLTAALPPVALFFSMTVGFGVMKRVYLNKKNAPVITDDPSFRIPAPGPSPEWQRVSPVRSGPETLLTETSQPLTENPAETSQALAENLAALLTENPSQPLTETSQTVLTPITETLSRPLTENPAPVLPVTLNPTETFAGGEFKVTPKSFSQPRDDRPGLTLPEKRVRDMYDVDPDISVNAVAKALGVAWPTAKKYYDATRIARGLTA